MKIFTPTAEELAEVLRLHKLWLDGGEAGKRAILDGARLVRARLDGASLVRASLDGARLDGARLDGASLDGASLVRARLDGASLVRASLVRARLDGASLDGARLDGARLDGARLDGASLVRARLDGASLPTGEKWEQYLAEVLPALIKSGGKSVEEVVAKSWNCHEWTNCPMAEAFGVHKESETPILLQPRVRQFIQLFDARLIVAEQQPDGTYLFKSKPQVEAPAVVEGAK